VVVAEGELVHTVPRLGWTLLRFFVKRDVHESSNRQQISHGNGLPEHFTLRRRQVRQPVNVRVRRRTCQVFSGAAWGEDIGSVGVCSGSIACGKPLV
jgi:hypothetical protein